MKREPEQDIVRVRVIKGLDDDGNPVSFTDPTELDRALSLFTRETEEAMYSEVDGFEYWTILER